MDEIIIAAQRVVPTLTLNSPVSDWLVYGRALNYGKNNTANVSDYSRWIDDNDLRLSDEVLRINAHAAHKAKRLFINWPTISKLIEDGKIAPKNHDMTSIIKAFDSYAYRKLMKTEKVGDDYDLSGFSAGSVLKIMSAMIFDLQLRGDAKNANRASRVIELLTGPIIHSSRNQ